MDYKYGSIKSKNIFKKIKKNKKIIIETGTYLGKGVEWALKHFDRVISIELLDKFYEPVAEKFKENDRVTIVKGNSADVLSTILEDIDESCFIYLDAHGDIKEAGLNPLYKELKAINEHLIKTHIIIIDDVRRFGVENDPNWIRIDIKRLKKMLYEINNDYRIFTFKDMLVAALKEDLNLEWWDV